MRLLRLVISTQRNAWARRVGRGRAVYPVGTAGGRGCGTVGSSSDLRENMKVRSTMHTNMNSLVGVLLSDAQVLPGPPKLQAPRVPPFMYSAYHLRERSRGGRKSTHGRPKAVTWPATAVSTSRSVTDRQLHRHTHSCETRVEAPRQTAPSRALEALRRGGPCPVEEDRRQGGLGGADESPPN